PFWVDGQGWTPAESLKQDDILLNKAGEKLSLDRIEIRLERSQVFNFEVGGAHNYYVTQKQVLVHNPEECGGSKPSPTNSSSSSFDFHDLYPFPDDLAPLGQDELPQDVIGEIAKYSESRERMSLHRTSERFSRLVNEPTPAEFDEDARMARKRKFEEPITMRQRTGYKRRRLG
ncbi:MAG: polymorphic toxin-type HINT domain-containing protein, partial [Crocosphaera sp.]